MQKCKKNMLCLYIKYIYKLYKLYEYTYMYVNTCKYFQSIYMHVCVCVYSYIHNKYTQYAHIYYVNKK